MSEEEKEVDVNIGEGLSIFFMHRDWLKKNGLYKEPEVNDNIL